MVGSDENNAGVIRPANLQGSLHAGDGKFAEVGIGQNRRALSNINRNIIGAPLYPCAVNKRGLSEKNAICDKNQAIPVHRPITRKFAAQLANKKQSILEENKKPTQFAPTPSESQECTIVDVEDYKADSDFPVPMFVQHTEAMLQEIDRMQEEEVEMEDVAEEPIMDIDISDKKDSLAVVEYIDDIYAHYRKAEVI